jgi:uncharacterized protein (TIGR03437 family)
VCKLRTRSWDSNRPHDKHLATPLCKSLNTNRSTLLSSRSGCLALLVAFVLMSLAASAQVTDYTIDTGGPHHVVQGHYMFFWAQGRVLAGTDVGGAPGTVPSLSGLPPGATGEFVNLIRFCCKTWLYTLATNNPIKISTSPTTPVGAYPVQLTYKSALGIQRSVTYTIYVDPLPSAVHKTGNYFPPDAPLASLAKWQSNMVTYGKKHCTPAEAGVYSDYTVPYYDGTRVYYQIADLTGDSSFNDCAGLVYGGYSTYVNTYNGKIPGYNVFPHGLAMRFQRTGDVAARQTLATLQNGDAYSNLANVTSVIDWSRSRETSYGIETNLVDQSVGGVPSPYLQDLVEAQLGQFDQWFVSKSAPYIQPFMVGLAAEALIQYWEVSHDPRVLPTLQMAADQVWTQSWDTATHKLRYWEGDGTFALYSDLNLLLAPMYGWVYQQTGAQIYRDQGDELFNYGVAGAWLDGGKQFSQNYRWSPKYVEWRNLAGQTGGNGLMFVSAASLRPGPVAPESWVAAVGTQLADGTASMMTSPVPTKLGGSTITVRDANGVEHAAGLNYVSPTYINFAIPAGTALGFATVTIYSGDQIRAVGSVDILATEPGLFVLNQDGLANASVLRVRGDSYDYESIIQLDPTTNQFVGIPIDLGFDTDQVYLTLYGTGLRFRPSLDSVSVTIGGLPAPVVYAGAADYYDAIDIVNVLLPQKLRGRGNADVVLMVNGAWANIVQVLIQ